MTLCCSVVVFGLEKSLVFAHSAEILDEMSVSPNEVIPSLEQCLHV